MLSNNTDRKIVNEIMEVTRANEGKEIKWIFEFKNKSIIFTYYLKSFLTLNYIIMLFYQTYLIYLITEIKLLSYFKLLSWFTNINWKFNLSV